MGDDGVEPLKRIRKTLKKNLLPYMIFLILLAVPLAKGTEKLLTQAEVQAMHAYSEESEEFRDMLISEKIWEQIQQDCDEYNVSFSEYLAAAMVLNHFDLSGSEIPDAKQILKVREFLQKKKPDSYQRLSLAYEKIFTDLKYFPVPKNSGADQEEQFFFENGYGEARSFGGDRNHEGIDIFGKETLEGYYPVVSMTDGIVEKIGWLPLGGYRIGIRSPHGGYFYYAHLASYWKNYREGDRIAAGDVLGFMGSTGYGPEGTEGKFPVHLHFGIYISTSRLEEMSVNPYWVLLLMKNQTQEYHY